MNDHLNVDLPVTLYPSRLRWLALLLVALMFNTACIRMLSEGDALGYLGLLCFGSGVPIAALQLYPRASYLHLTSVGFTYAVLFRTWSFRWRQIEEFDVVPAIFRNRVAWRYCPAEPFSETRGETSKSTPDRYARLPETYGMKATELADLMESLRQEFS